MSLKFRLTILSFLQFFIWGAWLITIGAYWFQNKQWGESKFGLIFSTMGISAIFMPTLTGIIADRFINAEKLLGICHLAGAAAMFCVPMVNDPTTFFWVILLNMIFYMPTIALGYTTSYNALKMAGNNVVIDFPPIRVWGTIGFIAAMWMVSLLHLETTSGQFYVSGAASLILGLYSFSLPACKPGMKIPKGAPLIDVLGLRAFKLFRQWKMALFFIFAMLLGAALQLTNAYGDTFLHDFSKLDIYKESVAVKYPAVVLSISQISETVFILAIPFMLRRFGIKNVMLFSMIAWVLRFGLLAYSNPAEGLWMIVLSCIVYGLAFDFFNISGSLFIETQSESSIKASAQGVFMMMTNGFGAFFGSSISGWVIENFYKLPNGEKDWQGIWIAFSAYALVVAILFAILFKHKHDPNEVAMVNH